MQDSPADSIFATKLTDLPAQPGVYIMRDAEGAVIYVGKAKNLRHRLRSYLHPERGGAKVKALVQKVHDVDCIVTANELEALILESNLVRQRARSPDTGEQPRQGKKAAIQHRAEGRQAVSISQDHERNVPEASDRPPVQKRRRALFRPVRPDTCDTHDAKADL